MEQKKSEEALRTVQKNYDLWRSQNERDEARRLQSSGNSRRVRTMLDLRHHTSSESCRSLMFDYDEEMTLEPPRKRPEWPEWEETTGREEDAWKLEPEEETEVPETVIVADEVEEAPTWTLMVRATMGEGKSKIIQVKVACQVRKVKKIKSPETQDHVGEAKSTDQEEVQELSFVPSAISVPQKMIFRCDNHCSEKTLSFWQLASVVINEGEESYTTNLCQKCFNNSLNATGEKPLSNVQWREFAEQKAYRGSIWRIMGEEPYVRGMREYFSLDGRDTRSVAAGIASQRIVGASEMLP